MRGRWMAYAMGKRAGRGSDDSANNDKETELEKLVKMHDRGDLSDEEFEKAKKKLLG